MGRARVSVPVVTMSPAASGGLTGSCASELHQMAQGRYRPVEHIRGAAAIGQSAVAVKIDLEGRQLAQPVRLARRDGMTPPDQQRAMHGIGALPCRLA